ncbi:MAG: S9 family peptidase [Alteromonadaceae bacterium]|nr:S9 family peptidase [Alteromonadaceae bacterium]
MTPQAFFAFALTLCSFFTLASKAEVIPLSSFNQMPLVVQPSLSPDGKNIAVITNRGEQTQVSVSPYDNPKEIVPVAGLDGAKYRIESIAWANNERILITVTQPIKYLYYQLRTSHIYSVKIDGSSLIELKSKKRVKDNLDAYRSSPHLLSLLDKEPNHILVTIKDWQDEYYSSVYKVNIETGDFKKYIPNGNKIYAWHVNTKGEVLMARGTDRNQKSGMDYFYTRKNNDDDWQLIKKRQAYADETFAPVLYEQENNSVIVISNYKLKKNALWRYHITSDEYELLGEAPDLFDIDGAITRLDGDTRTVVGFSYTDHFKKRVYFNEQAENLNLQIQSIFLKQGLQASIYDWDKNRQRFIVYVVSDTQPGQFYLFDKKVNKLSPWYGQYPSLKKHKLTPVRPIEFKARDGMVLYGYVTLPEGIKNPPLVVYPHGGPYGVRDTQYFDPFVQLFASRGYAVLQVNYRGSGGYGDKYLTSGYSQWGRKMQTDIIDAVNWVKKQNVVDTENACIVGGSYGGYAALAAGYQTPKQFNCIVSIAGVSDMERHVSTLRRFSGTNAFIENAINEDETDFEAISPVDNVNQFEAPVLLIHGKVDQRVSYRQSENMYEELKDAKKEVEYKLFEFGTHHLDDAVIRKQAMGLMIEFVDKHIKETPRSK